MHILEILKELDRLCTPEDIYSFISAELLIKEYDMSGSDELKILFGVNVNDKYFIEATYEEHMKAHMDHKVERTKCNEFGKHVPHISKYLNIREAVRSKMIHWLYSFADGNLRNLKCMKNFKYDE